MLTLITRGNQEILLLCLIKVCIKKGKALMYYAGWHAGIILKQRSEHKRIEHNNNWSKPKPGYRLGKTNITNVLCWPYLPCFFACPSLWPYHPLGTSHHRYQVIRLAFVLNLAIDQLKKWHAQLLAILRIWGDSRHDSRGGWSQYPQNVHFIIVHHMHCIVSADSAGCKWIESVTNLIWHDTIQCQEALI